MNTPIKFVFFGTPDRAVWVLEALAAAGLLPQVVVTQPDKPQGRKLIITPPPVKVWAQAHSIPVLQPEQLDAAFEQELKKYNPDVAVVIAYGKIIPTSTLNIPRSGSLNIHGSLLPKYRGSSPVETAILNDDRQTGVSIILMDENMDHGPIVAQATLTPSEWPPTADELARMIVGKGAKLLIELLPQWLAGNIKPQPQEHSKATFSHKIKKEDGQIDLSADPYKNFLKIQAYKDWPKAFFFTSVADKKTRVIITEASYANGKLDITKVIPEGGKEIPYQTFMQKISRS